MKKYISNSKYTGLLPKWMIAKAYLSLTFACAVAKEALVSSFLITEEAGLYDKEEEEEGGGAAAGGLDSDFCCCCLLIKSLKLFIIIVILYCDFKYNILLFTL